MLHLRFRSYLQDLLVVAVPDQLPGSSGPVLGLRLLVLGTEISAEHRHTLRLRQGDGVQDLDANRLNSQSPEHRVVLLSVGEAGLQGPPDGEHVLGGRRPVGIGEMHGGKLGEVVVEEVPQSVGDVHQFLRHVDRDAVDVGVVNVRRNIGIVVRTDLDLGKCQIVADLLDLLEVGSR